MGPEYGVKIDNSHWLFSANYVSSYRLNNMKIRPEMHLYRTGEDAKDIEIGYLVSHRSSAPNPISTAQSGGAPPLHVSVRS